MVAPEPAVLALARTIVEPMEAWRADPEPPAIAPLSALIVALGGGIWGVSGAAESPAPDEPPQPDSNPRQQIAAAAAAIIEDFIRPPLDAVENSAFLLLFCSSEATCRSQCRR